MTSAADSAKGLKLWLPGHVTPSLNELLGQHWSQLHRLKREARLALRVRITRHACRVLDADNFAGGCKFLIDAMRHERLIPDDDPASITLAFEQVRVSHRVDEGTEIVIEPGA